MKVSIIAAVADNGVIGKDGGLPWHIPSDLKRFKKITSGHAVIMGRGTWDSINRRPLPGRLNIVVTRQHDYDAGAEGVLVRNSLQEALDAARESGETEAFVLGGEAVFREALGLADTIYLTRVHAQPDGDTRFPDIDGAAWCVADEERTEAGSEGDQHPTTYQRLVRD